MITVTYHTFRGQHVKKVRVLGVVIYRCAVSFSAERAINLAWLK